MAKKHKSSVKTKLFARSGVRALAVVALVIGTGGLILPQILAADGAQPVYRVYDLSVRSIGTNSFRFSWNGSTPDHYTVRVGSGNGDVTERQVRSTSSDHNGLTCGRTYNFNVVPAYGNNTQVGNNSNKSISAATAACPAPPPATPPPSTPPPKTTPQPPTPTPSPPPTSTPSPGKSTPASSPSTSRLRATTSRPATTGGDISVAPTAAPETPANFTANISSNKVVELSWDTASNASRYIITRSTDNSNFTQIADIEETSYSDESADFSTTYYYQLTAVGSDEQASAPASVQAVTEAFEASSNKITSDDKKVTVTIPDGAIDGDYSCTLSSDDSASQAPAGQTSILGPYDLLCVTADGEVVDTYNSGGLPVTMQLGKSAEGYKDLSVQLASSNRWSVVKAITYDQNKQTIGFKLTSAKSFGVFGVKTKSPVWIFIVIFFILLLIAAVIFFLIRRRRNQTNDYSSYTAPAGDSDMSAAGMLPVAAPTAQEEFRQAVAQPDCSHLDQAQQVLPSSVGCLECEQQGTKWNSLRICLICGHVGCSDDSDQQHALKHFQETGHPLIYEYGNEQGNSIGWCYIDQTYI